MAQRPHFARLCCRTVACSHSLRDFVVALWLNSITSRDFVIAPWLTATVCTTLWSRCGSAATHRATLRSHRGLQLQYAQLCGCVVAQQPHLARLCGRTVACSHSMRDFVVTLWAQIRVVGQLVGSLHSILGRAVYVMERDTLSVSRHAFVSSDLRWSPVQRSVSGTTECGPKPLPLSR